MSGNTKLINKIRKNFPGRITVLKGEKIDPEEIFDFVQKMDKAHKNTKKSRLKFKNL